MLKAVQAGKLRGLVLAGEGSGERRALLEDLLTASVFGRVRYFSADRIEALFDHITASLGGSSGRLGAFEQMLFWPQYELDGKRVELDVAVEFENVVVGVEAKRVDLGARQSAKQIKEEMDAVGLAALGETGELAKDVIIFAVGGKPAELSSDENSVVQLGWREFWDILSGVEMDEAGARIREDIQGALELAGLCTKDRVFMSSLFPVKITMHRWLERRWLSPVINRRLCPVEQVGIGIFPENWRFGNESKS